MAVTWVRGQRCGVNNCSSRFYQVSGGHRVCQNGHVQEGFEAAADDDDFAAVGRRINIRRPQDAAAQAPVASKVVHGRAAFQLSLRLMQDVLQAQVAWMRRKKGFDAAFERAVRSLWTAYVAHVVKPSSKSSNPLSVRDLVVLCYLGSRCVGARILLTDFLRWIPLEDFPYVSSQKWLDASKFEKVPIEQRRIFAGLSTPTRMTLHERTMALRPQLENILHIRIPPVDAQFAVLRFCRELMLPPEMYVGACALLRDRFPRRKQWVIEELPMALAVVVAVKMAYGLDGLPRVLPAGRQGEQIDWGVWKDVVRKTWVYQPNPTLADERLAMFWDEQEIDNYLAWQQHMILPEDKPNDRLLAMFPLRAPPPQYEMVDNDTLTELSSVVHSTSAPHEETAEAPDPLTGPGSRYEIYVSRREFAEPLPEVVEALYEAVAALFNIDDDEIRAYVRGFEGWVRRTYGTEAYWDAPQNRDESQQPKVSGSTSPEAAAPENSSAEAGLVA